MARLDTFPPGLAGDTAYNGLDIQQLLAGHLAIFFPNNHGREALFIYLQALLVAFGGQQPLVLGFASVLMAMLTIAASFRLFEALFGWRIGLLAAALLSLSFWSLSFSRIGLRTTMVGPLLAASLYCLLRLLETRRRSYALLGGLAMGLSLYTYIAARLIPILALLICLIEMRKARKCLKELGLAAIAFMVVFAPEGVYFLQHGQDFGNRAREVSVFNPHPDIVGTPSTPGRSLLLTAGMLLVSGDTNRQHNLPGEPALPLPEALLFVAGLLLALIRARKKRGYLWPLAWLVVMLIPSALSHSSPDMLQALSAAPAAYLFPALALDLICAWLPAWGLGSALAFSAVLALGAEEGYRYFGRWAGDPRTQALFAVTEQRLAQYVNAQPEGQVFVAFPFDDTLPAFRYAQRPTLDVRWFPGEGNFVPIPRTSQSALYIAASSAALNDNVMAWIPGALAQESISDALGQTAFRSYRLPAAARDAFLSTQQPLGADLGDDFRLNTYELVSPPGKLVANLIWQPLQPAGPYDLSAHLVDSTGRQVAQSDRIVWPLEKLVGSVTHATDGSFVAADDLLLTHHEFEAAPGEYVLEVSAIHLQAKAPWQAGGSSSSPIGQVLRIPAIVNP